jgi:hypothetical protein
MNNPTAAATIVSVEAIIMASSRHRRLSMWLRLQIAQSFQLESYLCSLS